MPSISHVRVGTTTDGETRRRAALGGAFSGGGLSAIQSVSLRAWRGWYAIAALLTAFSVVGGNTGDRLLAESGNLSSRFGVLEAPHRAFSIIGAPAIRANVARDSSAISSRRTPAANWQSAERDAGPIAGPASLGIDDRGRAEFARAYTPANSGPPAGAAGFSNRHGPCAHYGSPENSEVENLLLGYRGDGLGPIWADNGRSIIFAAWSSQLGQYPNLATAGIFRTTADGRQIRRLVGEPEATYVNRWRYDLERITSIDVSADGTALVYATCRSDASVYVADGSIDPPQRVASLTYPGGNLSFFVGDDLYEITLVRLDQGTATRLRTGNYPVWSPDGARIAFLVAHSRQTIVFTMAADGTDVHPIQLPSSHSVFLPPQWSPDGSQLAFVVSEEGARLRGSRAPVTHAVYTANADGTHLNRLADTTGNVAWSPDGTRLAFANARARAPGLYTVAPDGTDLRRVTARTATWVPTVAWSADGSRILYLCHADSYPELCLVDLDGRKVHGFTWAGPETAALSPDGSQLAFYGGNGAMLSRIAVNAEHWWEKQVIVEIPDVWVADQAANVGAVPVPATSADCGAGLVVTAPVRNPGLVRDCQTLVGLRADLFGSSPTNWGPQVPLAQWHGVVVAGAPPRVRGLDLGDGGMGGFPHGGRLPPAVGELAFLVRLDLSDNDIGAPVPYQARTRGTQWVIPPQWGDLRRLEFLDLSGNRLLGDSAGYVLPREFGNLIRLRELRMRDAGTGGFLPPELGRLRNLEVLDLGENNLRGSIPPEFGRLTGLTELNLAGGDLSGPIPGELGRPARLRGAGFVSEPAYRRHPVRPWQSYVAARPAAQRQQSYGLDSGGSRPPCRAPGVEPSRQLAVGRHPCGIGAAPVPKPTGPP